MADVRSQQNLANILWAFAKVLVQSGGPRPKVLKADNIANAGGQRSPQREFQGVLHPGESFDHSLRPRPARAIQAVAEDVLLTLNARGPWRDGPGRWNSMGGPVHGGMMYQDPRAMTVSWIAFNL